MGVTGMVALPTTPPIVRTGARGLSGLIGAWMIAGIALALAAQSETAKSMIDQPLAAYPPIVHGARIRLAGPQAVEAGLQDLFRDRDVQVAGRGVDDDVQVVAPEEAVEVCGAFAAQFLLGLPAAVLL